MHTRKFQHEYPAALPKPCTRGICLAKEHKLSHPMLAIRGGCIARSPKGPKIEKNQSRLKISISLENFNLD